MTYSHPAGIIIDTFGELRGERAAKKLHMDTLCFICGVDRFTFDTKGKGFERHITKDHNMWQYLALLIHIRQKISTEYNGWEAHVASKLEAGDASFMPLNTALVLEQKEETDETQQQIEELKEAVSLLAEQNETILQFLKKALQAKDPDGGGPKMKRSKTGMLVSSS